MMDGHKCLCSPQAPLAWPWLSSLKVELALLICICSLVRSPQGVAHICRIVFKDLAGWQQQGTQTHLDNIDKIVHCAVLLHEYVSIVDLVFLQWQGRHRPGHQQDCAAITRCPGPAAAALQHSCSGSAPLHWQLGRGHTAVQLYVQAGGGFSAAVHATGGKYVRGGTGLVSSRTWNLPLYPSPKLGSCIPSPEGLPEGWLEARVAWSIRPGPSSPRDRLKEVSSSVELGTCLAGWVQC